MTISRELHEKLQFKMTENAMKWTKDESKLMKMGKI